MFNRKVVFVIGAGASFEYRMPLGTELAASIAKDVNFRFEYMSSTPKSGDRDLFQLLIRRTNGFNEALKEQLESGRRLAASISSSVSVDSALYQMSENPKAVELGKVAIIRAILRAEAQSALSTRTGAPVQLGWVEQLFSMATDLHKYSEIPQAFRNVTIVNFNYDRCIEQSILLSLERLGFSDSAAHEVVGSLTMLRPYGRVGSLDPSDSDHVQFGGAIDPFKAVRRIRTYTESEFLHDSDRLSSALYQAALIIFLGFGFHKQNLLLLKSELPGGAHLLATVKGIDEANYDDLLMTLASGIPLHQPDISLYDMGATELLQKLRPKIMIKTG